MTSLKIAAWNLNHRIRPKPIPDGVVDAIRPGRLFSLGLRGFLGTFLWLIVPTILFSVLLVVWSIYFLFGVGMGMLLAGEAYRAVAGIDRVFCAKLDHHGRTRLERLSDAGQGGSNTGVFGDAPVIVLWHVQVGTDENTAALDFALGAQIGKAYDVHVEILEASAIGRLTPARRPPDARREGDGVTSRVPGAKPDTRPCRSRWCPEWTGCARVASGKRRRWPALPASGHHASR